MIRFIILSYCSSIWWTVLSRNQILFMVYLMYSLGEQPTKKGLIKWLLWFYCVEVDFVAIDALVFELGSASWIELYPDYKRP